jgi:membrane fusion protein (multidrug efflux system)
VRVELPAIEDIIALPQTAVVTSLYGDYVFVVEKDETPPPQQQQRPAAGAEGAAPPPPAERLVAKQVFVEVGRRQRNMIEIVKGLEPGQSVVTSGQNKLANNAPVTIDNSVDPAALALDGGDVKQ